MPTLLLTQDNWCHLFYIYLKASAKIVLSPAEEAAAGFTDFNN